MGRRLLAALVLSLLARAALAGALEVAVISDLNGSYGATDYDPRVSAAIERIIALKPDLVISAGDMVAGQRRPLLTEAEVRAMWRGCHAAVSDPLAAADIPLVVTPGNHDASGCDGFEMERRIFAEEWAGRQPELDFRPGDHRPFDYALDLDGVRFASLDATEVGRMDEGQQAWLADAMAGAGRPRILFLYAIIGMTVGFLVLHHGYIIGFVIFGMGGLMRFRADTSSTADTTRLIPMTLLGLCVGLDLPVVAFVATLTGWLVVLALGQTEKLQFEVAFGKQANIQDSSDALAEVLAVRGFRTLASTKTKFKPLVLFVVEARGGNQRAVLMREMADIQRTGAAPVEDWHVD